MQRALALFLLLSPFAACRCEDAYAKVGATSIDGDDLSLWAQRLSPRSQDAQSPLTSLIDRQLLAEGATKDSLAESSTVRARLRAAEREILAEAYLEKRLADATTEKALLARYQATKDQLGKRQIHVRHIALNLAKDAGPAVESDARAKANAIRDRLIQGEDFAKLAAELSDDKPSASKGGDLPPTKEGDKDASFFDAAYALDQGSISQPVRSRFGVHVIQAIDPPTIVVPSFPEAKGRLAADARREAEKALMVELKERIPVKILKQPEPTK